MELYLGEKMPFSVCYENQGTEILCSGLVSQSWILAGGLRIWWVRWLYSKCDFQLRKI